MKRVTTPKYIERALLYISSTFWQLAIETNSPTGSSVRPRLNTTIFPRRCDLEYVIVSTLDDPNGEFTLQLYTLLEF